MIPFPFSVNVGPTSNSSYWRRSLHEQK